MRIALLGLTDHFLRATVSYHGVIFTRVVDCRGAQDDKRESRATKQKATNRLYRFGDFMEDPA
jgi:hypothetical protein